MRIFMRFPEGRAKALTLSYDDGVVQDEQMMKLLDENGIKATFNLNSGLYPEPGTVYPAGEPHRVFTKDQATAMYTDSRHEVACHGLTHAFMEKLPEHCAVYEAAEDRKNLEQQFGRPVIGLAYPWGTYSDMVVEAIKKAGIAYARTTGTTGSFPIPEDWLRWHPTCHHFHPQLMEFAKRFVEQTPADEPYDRTPWLFYLWGHTYEFEAVGSWSVIEEFARYVGNKEDIWYATNGEVYRYVEAFRHLEWALDGSSVYNPTACEVWFESKGTVYSAAPGALLRLPV